eukprot:GHVP01036651.1.p1 GENE.GHVP01036651.1~~GHVP01036651.1.p1  ORF type:complete len:111 (-),score=16.67 GHVP01036651.1:60-392(-)
MLTSKREGENLYIMTIGILREYRRRGYGRLLLKRLLEESTGSRSVSLHASLKDEGVVDFYEGLGFHIIEHLKMYYGPDEDGVYMRASVEELRINVCLDRPFKELESGARE